MNTPKFTAVFDASGSLSDICAEINGRKIFMLGHGGADRECAIIRATKFENCLPVLLGAGLGYAIKELLQIFPDKIAVIEKETELQAISKVRENLSKEEKQRILWLTDQEANKILADLTNWQKEQQGLRFLPLVLPFYQRLDSQWYGFLREQLQASAAFDFWAKAVKPRFQHDKPRLLLMTSKYFLMGEIIRACDKLGLEYKLLLLSEGEVPQNDFIQQLLTTVLEFQPDCCLTMNHMGVDREGVLMDLLSRLQLPLASWFVDNPHLIVHLYQKCVSPWTALFSYDADTVDTLHTVGFPHVFYLPLGTDPERFCPSAKPVPKAWKAEVSFVGNSMIYKVGARLKKTKLPRGLLLQYKKVSEGFLSKREHSVAKYIEDYEPEAFKLYLALPDNESRLAFETVVTWQSTRLYRNACVRQLLPFKPLIVGDEGWQNIEFRNESQQPRYLGVINYYHDLPKFYAHSAINFNCTSQQMKGAVNQRIFDGPAAGGFVLTDWREQMAELFDPDQMAYYQDKEEIPDKIRYYLKNPSERQKILEAGRKRVLAEHTWDRRLQILLNKMREIYGTPKVSKN